MSISERCHALRSRIAERNSLLRAHQDAESIRARTEDFAQLRSALQLRIHQCAILTEHQVPRDSVRDPVQIIDTLKELSHQVCENYDEASRQLGRLKRTLGTLSNHLSSVVTKAVQDLKGGIPASDEVFLKQVELIPTYAPKVAQIRAERDAILDGNDPMASSDALKYFLLHLGSLKAASDTLNPDEFPADVLKFFKAVRHADARLDDLTPGVHDWLVQQNLLKHVRVTIVS
jgi:hypothetical protein